MNAQDIEVDTISSDFWINFMVITKQPEVSWEGLMIEISSVSVDFLNRDNCISHIRLLGGQLLVCFLKLARLKSVELNLKLEVGNDEAIPPDYVFFRGVLNAFIIFKIRYNSNVIYLAI